jgi:hypothetical protein
MTPFYDEMMSVDRTIEYLTELGDLVLGPFGGSGTTGAVAERLGRRWACIEIKLEYAEQARIRFEDPFLSPERPIHSQERLHELISIVTELAAANFFAKDGDGRPAKGLFVGRPFYLDYDHAHLLIADA